MLVLASFDEDRNLTRLRCYRDAAQFWEEFERFPELKRMIEIEQPEVNIWGTFGNHPNEKDQFPMYIIPEGIWQAWDGFYRLYIEQWKGSPQ